MSKLEQENILDNTFVYFTTDYSLHLEGVLEDGKGTTIGVSTVKFVSLRLDMVKQIIQSNLAGTPHNWLIAGFSFNVLRTSWYRTCSWIAKGLSLS